MLLLTSMADRFPTTAELQTHMGATGDGYRRTAKHFGIAVELVRQLLGLTPRADGGAQRAKPSPKDPPEPTEIPNVADISREAYLRESLIQIEAAAFKAMKQGSWQAASSLKRQAGVTRGELDDLRGTVGEEFDPRNIDHIVERMLQMPEGVWSHPLILERIGLVH